VRHESQVTQAWAVTERSNEVECTQKTGGEIRSSEERCDTGVFYTVRTWQAVSTCNLCQSEGEGQGGVNMKAVLPVTDPHGEDDEGEW
jgi:hypothetical protein